METIYKTGTKQIAIENDGNLHLVNDNQNLVFGANKDAVIRFDGTNLVIDPDVYGIDTGLVYIDGNISATDLIDRTSVYDKTKGNALNYVKDSSQLENNGEIDHSQFYGYTAIETTDFDKPVLVLKDVNECTPKDINVCKQETDIEGKVVEVCEISQTEECSTVKKYVKTYPYKKIVEGVSISKEMALLRQQVYDLKTENDLIKNELCKTNPTYTWCK